MLDEGALVGLSALNGDPGPRRRYVQLQLPAAPPTTESLPVQIKAAVEHQLADGMTLKCVVCNGKQPGLPAWLLCGPLVGLVWSRGRRRRRRQGR